MGAYQECVALATKEAIHRAAKAWAKSTATLSFLSNACFLCMKHSPKRRGPTHCNALASRHSSEVVRARVGGHVIVSDIKAEVGKQVVFVVKHAVRVERRIFLFGRLLWFFL